MKSAAMAALVLLFRKKFYDEVRRACWRDAWETKTGSYFVHDP